MQYQNYTFDVVIIGAGPAGASAALTILNQSNLRVAIVEQSNLQKLRVGESVSSSLFPLLEYLQVPKHSFETSCFEKTQGTVAFWGSDEAVQRHSIFAADVATFQLNRESFDLTLLESVDERGGMIFPRTKVQSLNCSDDGAWQLSLQHEDAGHLEMEARFIIDASGRNSSIAKKIGCQSESLDKLTAVGAFMDLEQDASLPSEQFMESTENGWWYIARLPNDKAVVTFFSDADVLAKERLNRSQHWLEALQTTQHTRHFLAKQISPEFDLWLKKANSSYSTFKHIKNYIAVGDAACSFDPISSMGLGFAMTSAAQAGVTVISIMDEPADIIAKNQQQFEADIHKNFQNYLCLRNMFYQKESRWQNAPFWQRRMAA